MLDLIGLVVRVQGLSGLAVRGVTIGGFVTAVITFFLTAAVVYFLIVVPYDKLDDLLDRDQPRAEPKASSEELLTEIRDLLPDRA